MIDFVDDSFECFYKDQGFGPVVHSKPVPPSKLAYYRGKVPDRLLQYWAAYGFAGYGDGLFWLTDPGEYSAVLDAWLEGTSFHGQDQYYVIGRSAFGELIVWGTRTGPCMKIVCAWAMIFPRAAPPQLPPSEADFLIGSWISGIEKEDLDETDEDDEPLFDRAVRLLGPLASNEMYGFVPALRMGGPCRIDHLQKVATVEHLVLLAKLGKPEVMRDIVKEADDQGLLD
jgi:hypothetical protein